MRGGAETNRHINAFERKFIIVLLQFYLYSTLFDPLRAASLSILVSLEASIIKLVLIRLKLDLQAVCSVAHACNSHNVLPPHLTNKP